MAVHRILTWRERGGSKASAWRWAIVSLAFLSFDLLWYHHAWAPLLMLTGGGLGWLLFWWRSRRAVLIAVLVIVGTAHAVHDGPAEFARGVERELAHGRPPR